MTLLLEEQIEILRRIAQRGLALAQRTDPVIRRNTPKWVFISEGHVDLWQHMLDEIGRLKP